MKLYYIMMIIINGLSAILNHDRIKEKSSNFKFNKKYIIVIINIILFIFNLIKLLDEFFLPEKEEELEED